MSIARATSGVAGEVGLVALAERSGLPYRVLDHAVRTGRVHTRLRFPDFTGSGNRRLVSATEADRVMCAAQLARQAGVSFPVALHLVDGGILQASALDQVLA